ncbi:MAG TPA: helix-turn-helix domain-containing protein [Ramlibacter sp.]|uniref:helix-turn-helix domain-containing protein n=1 Tax=Ramlibacter sp. TaxID=1917967 RepID=UPI002ED2990F
MKAAEWIDRLKDARGWESDYRAAKELGLSRNTISNYRSGTRTLDDETAVKVAEALEVEPEIIILDQHAERTNSEPARAALAGLLQRISGKAPGGGSAAVGRKGQVDITSAASATFAGGDPARNTHRISGSYRLP